MGTWIIARFRLITLGCDLRCIPHFLRVSELAFCADTPRSWVPSSPIALWHFPCSNPRQRGWGKKGVMEQNGKCLEIQAIELDPSPPMNPVRSGSDIVWHYGTSDLFALSSAASPLGLPTLSTQKAFGGAKGGARAFGSPMFVSEGLCIRVGFIPVQPPVWPGLSSLTPLQV
jgi:hypothetical protein